MPTTTITVTLDTAANPPVGLKDSAGKSSRDITVPSGNTIKFQRKGGSSFKVTDFADATPPPFSDKKTGGNGQWLTVDFNTKKPADTTFPFTLTVKQDNVAYTTSKSDTPPDGGRPVIRN